LEGDKISTSRNWAVWLHEYLEEFSGKQDVLRYVLTANAPETKDNDFTWKDFQARNNNELVAILGNFVNRAIVLTNKYFEGKVPERIEADENDLSVLKEIVQIKEKVEHSIEHFRFREALKEAMNLARLGNKYLAETEPWKLIKTDENRVKTILNIALQISASLSIVLEPFLPFTSEKIRKILAIDKIAWNDLGNHDLLKAGHKIGKAELLFAKIEDKEIEYQINKLLATKEQNKEQVHEPVKDEINYDDFMKMDIRSGVILEAEKVAKTKKLLKLKVDTGVDVRTVVSGIAEYFKPEEIIGKQVSLLLNLAPRKIRGIESQGMILMAEDKSGKLYFVAPQENIKPGALIK
ncbi:MAG: methionine--tRNA ligase subunit beta, partial [Bacteroidales bacterium]|nr:methionine--tRNA ligase subunit beta [Bacteroidales bacterium]